MKKIFLKPILMLAMMTLTMVMVLMTLISHMAGHTILSRSQLTVALSRIFSVCPSFPFFWSCFQMLSHNQWFSDSHIHCMWWNNIKYWRKLMNIHILSRLGIITTCVYTWDTCNGGHCDQASHVSRWPLDGSGDFMIHNVPGPGHTLTINYASLSVLYQCDCLLVYWW